MGLDLWGKEDIKNVLLSLRQATLQSGVDGDYRRGFEAALASTALAFGLATHPEHTDIAIEQLCQPSAGVGPVIVYDSGGKAIG